jgi:hypothetical protein
VTALGACGDIVGSLRALVGGDDPSEQLGGGAAAAAPYRVQVIGLGLVVFKLRTPALVEVGAVGVSAAGHRDVEQCAAGVFAEHGVGGVGGNPLGGVHRDGVAVGDVFAKIIAIEDGDGVVVQASGRQPIVVGVDGGDAPAVAVAPDR